MPALKFGVLAQGALTVLFLVRQVNTDCEICSTVARSENEHTFIIDSLIAETDQLWPFIRMRIGREKLSYDRVRLRINDTTEQFYGCYAAESLDLVQNMGDIKVTFMSRPLFNKSDKCVGFRQTSVRLARMDEDLLDIHEDSTVEVKWGGPSKVKEVCVGMEGGNCTIRGNSESHQRCFVRPTMEDGCEVRTLHDGQTVVVTSQRRNGSVWNVSDSLTLSDLDEVYVGSVKDDIVVSVDNILRSTMVEVMSAGKGSDKTVTLEDTSKTTLNLVGRGKQIARVSAVGDTFLSSFVSNNYRENRITINARCSQGLDLRFDIQGGPVDYAYWRRWSLRVGCPDGPNYPCKITDAYNGEAKQVVIAPKEAWLDDLVIVKGREHWSYFHTFAAFYTSEMSDECCFEDLCDFEKHCVLTSNGGRSFTYDDLCGSFVLSFYVPFVHILTAVVYLICVGSLLMLVCRDDRIQSSRNIKYITLSLCQSALFAVTWIGVTSFYGVIGVDLFRAMPSIQLNDSYFGYGYFLPIALSLLIAPDFRSLQVSLVNEIHDREFTQSGNKSWHFSFPTQDKYLFGLVFRSIGFGLLSVPLVNRLIYLVIFFSLELFPVAIAVGQSFFTALPDIGFFVGWVVFAAMLVSSLSNILLAFVVAAAAAHFWNFALIWGLVFRFAYGKSVMTKGTKAAGLIFIEMLKITRLFTQILDVFTDWTIIAFFFADGWVLFGLTESTFVLSAAMVSAYYEWDSFPHWWQRMITLMGLGRIIQVIDTGVNLETRTFLEETETHLESLPSTLLGMFVVLTTPRNETGPVLFSMGVTWFSLFLRALGTVMKLEFPALWKCLIFLSLFSDFFVRCVSPALIIAIIQGQQGSDYPKVGSILFFLGYFVTILAAYMVYYHRFYSGAVSRSPFYLRAMISTISVRCALFAYLRMDHYKHDAVIATPIDLAVLTIPHCLISLVFSSISVALLWDEFGTLSIVTGSFTLSHMACMTAMCLLNKNKFVFVDADQSQAKKNLAVRHEVVTSMSDVLSSVEDNPDSPHP